MTATERRIGTERRGQNRIISIADEDVCWGVKLHKETQSGFKNKYYNLKQVHHKTHCVDFLETV